MTAKAFFANIAWTEFASPEIRSGSRPTYWTESGGYSCRLFFRSFTASGNHVLIVVDGKIPDEVYDVGKKFSLQRGDRIYANGVVAGEAFDFQLDDDGAALVLENHLGPADL